MKDFILNTEKTELFNTDLFSTDLFNILKSNGRSKHPEDTNLLYLYYQAYNKQPQLFQPYSKNNNYYDWNIVVNGLKKYYKNPKIIYANTYYDIEKQIKYSKNEIWELDNELMVSIEGGLTDDFYLVNHNVEDIKRICSNSIFFHNGNFNDEEVISKIFANAQIVENKTVTIGMVSIDDGTFYVKDFDIMKNLIELNHLDLHYGDGFEDFMEELLVRLKRENKGLTLFHGEPGTGKCVKGNTQIKIRNKKTGLIEYIDIEKLL